MNKINYESLKFHHFLNELTDPSYQIKASKNSLTLVKNNQQNKWSKEKLELLAAYLFSHQKELTTRDAATLDALKGRVEKEMGQKSVFVQTFFCALEDLKQKIGDKNLEAPTLPPCLTIYRKVAEAPRTERDFKNNLELLVKHFPRYQLYNDLSIYNTKYTSMPPHWDVEIVYGNLINKINDYPSALSQEVKEFVKQELKPLEPVQMGILLDNSESNSAVFITLQHLVKENKASIVNRAFIKCHEKYIKNSSTLVDVYMPESEEEQLCLILPKGHDPKKMGFSVKGLKKWGGQQKLQPDDYVVSHSKDLQIKEELNKLLLEETPKKRFARIIVFNGHGLNPTNKQKGVIAGLPVEEFQETLTAVKKKNLSFLYLVTCFGGGENATQVQLSNQTLPCPVYIQSSFEAVSHSNLMCSYYPVLQEAEKQLIPPNSIGHPKSLTHAGIEKLTKMYPLEKNLVYTYNLPTLLLPANKSDIPKAVYGLSRKQIVDMDHWIKIEKRKDQTIEELRIPASQEVKGYLFSNPIIPFTLVDEGAETKTLLSRGGQTLHVVRGIHFPNIELADLLKNAFLFNKEENVKANKAFFIGHLTCKMEGKLATLKNVVIHQPFDSSSLSVHYIDSKGDIQTFVYSKPLTKPFKEKPISLDQYLSLVYETAAKCMPSHAHLLQTSTGRHSLNDTIDALNSLFFKEQIPEKASLFSSVLQNNKKAISKFLKTFPGGITESLWIASLSLDKTIIQTTLKEALKFAKENKTHPNAQNKEDFEKFLIILVSIDPSKPWILANQHLIKEAVSFYPQMLSYEENGTHVLHLLLQNGHFAFGAELLELAREEHSLDLSVSKNSNGATLLHTIIEKLNESSEASSEGKKLIQRLASFNPDLLTTPDTNQFSYLINKKKTTPLDLLLESPIHFSAGDILKLIKDYKIDFSKDDLLLHALIKGLGHQPFTKESQELLRLLVDAKPNLLTKEDSNDDTPLSLAAKNGTIALIKEVFNLARKHKIDGYQDKDLFDIVIRSLRKQTVTDASKALIREFVDSNPTILTTICSFKTTPLHRAVESGNIAFIKDIFHLASKYKQPLNAKNQAQETLFPSLINGLSQKTPTKESKRLLRQLVNLLPHVLDKADGYTKNTPLHIAMEKGSIAFIDDILQLAKENKLDLNVKNQKQETLLHSLVKNLNQRELTEESKKLIKQLVRFNPHLLTAQDLQRNTPLHLACSHGSIPFVEYMLKLADAYKQNLYIKNQEDLTVFHHLIANLRDREFTEESKRLIRNFTASHPNLLNAQDQEANSALHLALASNSVQFIEEMLALTGQNLTIKNKNNETILHILIRFLRDKGRIETHKNLIKKLIEKQPSLLTAKDSQGNTIWHLALETQGVYFIEEVFELAKEYQADLQVKNNRGETLFHVLIRGLSQVELTTDGQDLIERLIASDIEKLLEPDHEGNTPLDTAVKKGCAVFIQNLMKKAAGAKGQSKLEKAIFRALQRNTDSGWLIQEMVGTYPALLTARDEEGNTLFHAVIKNKKFDLFEALIKLAEEKGIEAHVFNDAGQKPVHLVDSASLHGFYYSSGQSLLKFVPKIFRAGKTGEKFCKELLDMMIKTTLIQAYQDPKFIQSLGHWKGIDSKENKILHEILDCNYDYNKTTLGEMLKDAAKVIELVTKAFQQRRGVFARPIGLPPAVSASLTALKNLVDG
jgi:ankyrin repeat protein